MKLYAGLCVSWVSLFTLVGFLGNTGHKFLDGHFCCWMLGYSMIYLPVAGIVLVGVDFIANTKPAE